MVLGNVLLKIDICIKNYHKSNGFLNIRQFGQVDNSFVPFKIQELKTHTS